MYTVPGSPLAVGYAVIVSVVDPEYPTVVVTKLPVNGEAAGVCTITVGVPPGEVGFKVTVAVVDPG